MGGWFINSIGIQFIFAGSDGSIKIRNGARPFVWWICANFIIAKNTAKFLYHSGFALDWVGLLLCTAVVVLGGAIPSIITGGSSSKSPKLILKVFYSQIFENIQIVRQAKHPLLFMSPRSSPPPSPALRCRLSLFAVSSGGAGKRSKVWWISLLYFLASVWQWLVSPPSPLSCTKHLAQNIRPPRWLLCELQVLFRDVRHEEGSQQFELLSRDFVQVQ